MWLVVLGLTVLVAFSISVIGGPSGLKIDKPLGVTGSPDVYNIPVGSTVTHLADGSTKIVGPDGRLIIFVTSDEVGLVSTPEGMAKATHVYETPSGSFVHSASPNTMEVYDVSGTLILTVIDEAWYKPAEG